MPLETVYNENEANPVDLLSDMPNAYQKNDKIQARKEAVRNGRSDPSQLLFLQ